MIFAYSDNKTIEDYINNNLTDEAKNIALDFVSFLGENDIEFFKDNSAPWKDKIYYHLKFENKFVGYIAVKDPDEPENLWTVWSDNSKAFENENVAVEIKETAYKHIDFCGNCGSCGGGRKKTVFGKEFNKVCGCTFRVDNPNTKDLPFLKKMIELCKEYIVNNDVIHHYNSLIDEGNDPVLDPKPLQDYMDKWDGHGFIDKMELGTDTALLIKWSLGRTSQCLKSALERVVLQLELPPAAINFTALTFPQKQ